MSSVRRFDFIEESVFKFTIDTRLGNGNNSFTIPFTTGGTNNQSARIILRVSDGRPDVSAVGTAQVIANRVISFASAGIYQITIIGFDYFIRFQEDKVDKDKIIYIDNWPNQVVGGWGFYMCSNLIVRANNPLVLPANSDSFFYGIKGFLSTAISYINTELVTAGNNIMRGIQNPLPGTLSPYWKNLPVLSLAYYGCTFDSSVSKVEIVSDTIVTIQQPFTNFRGRIVFKTPNLNKIDRLLNVSNPPSLGEIDIRSLTTITGFLTNYPLSQTNTDSTLLGWAGFDWNNVPTVPNKVTIDFKNSKHSNNTAVIAAKAFLESKGIVFTNLTMA